MNVNSNLRVRSAAERGLKHILSPMPTTKFTHPKPSSSERRDVLGAWKGNSDNVEPSDSSGDGRLHSID